VVALLGVPLDADSEAGNALDRLDNAVVGPGHGDQANPEDVHGLVVVGRDLEVLTAGEDAGQQFTGSDADPVPPEAVYRAAVHLVAHQVGYVLVQRAAAGNVHDLQAPADAKERNAPPDGRVGERELPLVTVGDGGLGLGVRSGAIPGRVDVTA